MVIRVNDRLRGVRPYSRSIEFLTIWRYNRIREEHFPHLYLLCLYIKPEALTVRSAGVCQKTKRTTLRKSRRFKMCHEQCGFARSRLPVYSSFIYITPFSLSYLLTETVFAEYFSRLLCDIQPEQSYDHTSRYQCILYVCTLQQWGRGRGTQKKKNRDTPIIPTAGVECHGNDTTR